jgi:hypothetical protein
LSVVLHGPLAAQTWSPDFEKYRSTFPQSRKKERIKKTNPTSQNFVGKYSLTFYEYKGRDKAEGM